MMAAGILLFCLFSSILSTVTSLKCQTCFASGNGCKEEDVKMVECKDNEEFCFAEFVNTTLINNFQISMTKKCSKRQDCYEGHYSTTTVDGKYDQVNAHCCQTDGCNAKPLPLQKYEDLQPNGLQCPGCYVQNADSCEAHQSVNCLDKEDQCINVTFSMVAFGNYTEKISFQGCTTKNVCSFPIGETQLGPFYFNVTSRECRNASSKRVTNMINK